MSIVTIHCMVTTVYIYLDLPGLHNNTFWRFNKFSLQCKHSLSLLTLKKQI